MHERSRCDGPQRGENQIGWRDVNFQFVSAGHNSGNKDHKKMESGQTNNNN
jgi:hypothetical protein